MKLILILIILAIISELLIDLMMLLIWLMIKAFDYPDDMDYYTDNFLSWLISKNKKEDDNNEKY